MSMIIIHLVVAIKILINPVQWWFSLALQLLGIGLILNFVVSSIATWVRSDCSSLQADTRSVQTLQQCLCRGWRSSLTHNVWLQLDANKVSSHVRSLLARHCETWEDPGSINPAPRLTFKALVLVSEPTEAQWLIVLSRIKTAWQELKAPL